jgi:hypothetical protein
MSWSPRLTSGSPLRSTDWFTFSASFRPRPRANTPVARARKSPRAPTSALSPSRLIPTGMAREKRSSACALESVPNSLLAKAASGPRKSPPLIPSSWKCRAPIPTPLPRPLDTVGLAHASREYISWVSRYRDKSGRPYARRSMAGLRFSRFIRLRPHLCPRLFPIHGALCYTAPGSTSGISPGGMGACRTAPLAHETE